MVKETEDLKNSLEIEQESNRKLKDRLSITRQELSEIRGSLDSKDSKLAELRTNLSKVKTNDELLEQIKELQEQLDEKTKESNKLFEERCELKRTISSQKKQLRLLDSRLIEPTQEDSTNIKQNNDTEVFDIEDAVSKLKDLSYIIVGGKWYKSLEMKLKDYGFENIKRWENSSRTVGKCDCVIVLTTVCHHDEVYSIESKARGTSTNIVYCTSLNADLVIKTLYEELIEC